MKGKYIKDASGRLSFEMIELPANDYACLRDAIIHSFNLEPVEEAIVGLNSAIQDFSNGDSTVGIEWDNWSGLCVVAKENADELVKEIGYFIEDKIESST